MAEYIANKIEVLKDFGIILKPEQLEDMKSLPNKNAIDRYCRPIILGIYH